MACECRTLKGYMMHVSGVDWGGVEKYVDLSHCYQHYLDPCYRPSKTFVWYLPWTWGYKKCADLLIHGAHLAALLSKRMTLYPTHIQQFGYRQCGMRSIRQIVVVV